MAEGTTFVTPPVTVDYIGPFSGHTIVVDGYSVPYLTARPTEGGRVELVLDHRFALDLDLQTAERVVPFLADAMAVAAGYSSHGEHSTPLNPFQRALRGITWTDGRATQGGQDG